MSKLKSLRWHMIIGNVGVFSGLLILFGIAITLIVSQMIVSDLHEHYNQEISAVNDNITKSIETPTNLLISSSQSFGQVDSLFNEKYTSAYFKSILNAFPYFSQIRLINTRGDVELVEPSNPKLLGSSVRNEPFFLNSMYAKQPIWSTVYISSQTNKPMVTLTLPAGKLLIVCDIDLGKFEFNSVSSGYKGFASMSLLDQYGNYISDSDILNVEQRRRYPNFEILKAAAGNNERFISLPNKPDHLFSAVPVGLQKNWYLVVSVEKAEAYESLKTIILFISLLLLTTGSFSYYFLNRNLKKVNSELVSLAESSLKFSEGAYEHNPSQSHYREIQALTDSFVEMARKINNREQEINALNEDLEEKVEERTKELILSNQSLNDINALLEEEIEERQRVEDELLLLNKTLEEKIVDRTLEITRTNLFLEETNAQLEEEIEEHKQTVQLLEQQERALNLAVKEANSANLSKRDFLANMSHEIRTPMNGILGMIEVLSYTNIDEEQASYLRTTKTAVYTLLNVLNDILDFSKIESGNLELRLEPFDLSHTFADLKRLYYGLHQRSNVTFEVDIFDHTPTKIIGDENRIRQVLTNFISNAYKFTSEGTIRLNAQQIKISNEKVTLKISVKDTGIGISKADQKTLFHRFTQLENSLTRSTGGTGLGLAISKMLIELLGGEVGVVSDLGQGSEFYFICEFDLHSTDSGQTNLLYDSVGKTTIADLSNKEILIVEDDKTSQVMLTLILAKSQVSITLANNGLEALEILRDKVFDLVLMDVSMPVMDGLQASRIIREEEILDRTGKPIGIVAMTAFAMEEDRKACLDAGMTHYLSKPIAFDKLMQVISVQ